MITVVLIDDHSILREGLRSILSFQPGIEVVGEAGDGDAALELISEKDPDVAVIDISMPVRSGIEVVRQASGKRTDFIILTMHSDACMILDALESGAKGYLLKEEVFEELTNAIKAVNNGKEYVSQSLLKELSDGHEKSLLTERQAEVLKLVTERGLNLPKTALHPILAKVRGWIEVNMSSSFTLPDAARENCTSVSHLSRLYKEHLEVSFTDDVNRIRVERARWLLRSTDDSVDSIREAVGYDSSQHFFIQFKKITGKTPRKYRLGSEKETT